MHRVLLLAIALLAGLVPGPALAAVPSVFLVQTSGWMEPFFTDPSSPFKPLLRALVAAAQPPAEPQAESQAQAGPGTRTVLAAFNQDGQVPGRRSPDVLLDAPYAPAPFAAAVDALRLAARPGNRLADTDLPEALSRAIATILDDRPGILWIVTNNKNSRNNDPAIDRNTRAFAELIRATGSLPEALAYPIRMPVTGRRFTERGLIVYAIAYGDEAAAQLSRTVAAPAMRQLFTEPPARLKRLEQAPVAFDPTAAIAPTVASLAAGDTLVLSNLPAAGGTVRVSGTLRSDYYPQSVARAALSLRWLSLGTAADPGTIPVTIEPASLANLRANGRSPPLTLSLAVPPMPRPAGLAGLLARTVTLRGTLELRLSDLSLSLDPAFTARMADIAALDQLPEIFADYQRVREARALIPVVLVVHLSAWPLVAASAAAALLLAAAAASGILLLRPRRAVIEAAGLRRAVALRPFQTVRFPAPDGVTVRVTGRLLGPPAVALDRAL